MLQILFLLANILSGCCTRHGVYVCDTPYQDLIGLIGYSYQQVAISFPEVGLQRTPRLFPKAGLQRTPRLSVLGPKKFGDGVTDREVLPGCARVRTKCAEKTGVGL